jgi:hypothetical protein
MALESFLPDLEKKKNTAGRGTFALPRKDFFVLFFMEMYSLLWDFPWIF